MVARHRQIQFVVAEFQREFAGAEELLVLPANGVVIRGHARKPLRDLENRVLVIFKIFIAGALDQHLLVIDLIRPVDAKADALAGRQRHRQIDAQHGLVDHIRQRLAVGRFHGGELEAAVEFSARMESAQVFEFQRFFFGAAEPGLARRRAQYAALVRILAQAILVQLQPQIREAVRRAVVIGDLLAGRDFAARFVQGGADHVIGALLPVGMARRAGRRAIAIRRGQQFFQLAELVVEGRGGAQAGQGDKQGQTQGKQADKDRHGAFHLGVVDRLHSKSSLFANRSLLWKSHTPASAMPRQHWRRHGHWRMMRLEHWGVVVPRSCRGNLYQHNWPAGHGAGGCRT